MTPKEIYDFEFNTSVCTSIEQSEYLLELGLKKETADCGHFYVQEEHGEYYFWETTILDSNWPDYWKVTETEIPAWSLDRLIALLAKYSSMGYIQVFQEISDEYYKHRKSLFGIIISIIEKRIENNYFNKDYLV